MRRELASIYAEYRAREPQEVDLPAASAPEELEAALKELLDAPKALLMTIAGLGQALRFPHFAYDTVVVFRPTLEGWEIIKPGPGIHYGDKIPDPVHLEVAEAARLLSEAGYTRERLEEEWLGWIKRRVEEREGRPRRW